MNIPILRLGEILLTSIQVDLTDQDVLEFESDVLTMVNETKASGIVIDITGLDVVDSFMARVFNDTATMVRILGTETVITGMQPTVALTLVEMGQDLSGIETALNLESGLERIKALIRERRVAQRQMDYEAGS